MLFGAILSPEGSRAAQDYDIVVVLEGPVQSIVLREKQKIRFAVQQMVDAMSPANFFATNPEAQKKLIETNTRKL